MQVIINGENITIAKAQTVSELIEELKLEGKIAIEINQNIVPRSQFKDWPLQANDKIEIVNAIGGG